MDRYKAEPMFNIDLTAEGKRCRFVGTKHTSEQVRTDEIYALATENTPNLLMHEGKDVRKLFEGMSDNEIRSLNPAEVVKMQEQAYVGWRAFCEGIETRSWDIPPAEQFSRLLDMKKEDGSAKHSVGAIQAWIAGTAMDKLYFQDHFPTKGELDGLIKVILSPQERSVLSGKMDTSVDALLQSLSNIAGKSYEDLAARFADPSLRQQDIGMLRGLVEPRKTTGSLGPTNYVLRDMNAIRDEHAVDMLHAARAERDNIAVIAGGSHVLTWGPAVQQLYKNAR